jgi:hypothetical protein
MRLSLPILLAASLAAGDAAPEPQHLDAKPSHVSRSTNLWFEDGVMRGGQDSLQIGLSSPLAEKLRIIDVEDLQLIEAIGDDGKPLQAAEHGAGGGGGGEPGTIDVMVMLAQPGPNVHAIRSLVVSAKARIAAEGLRRAVLKPAKSWIAKRMRIDGIEGGEIELEDLAAGSLTLGMTPAVERAIENLGFQAADGSDIDNSGWNDNQEPGWIIRKVEVALPDDGAIHLDLRQELGTRHFVLSAKNIPISLPNRSKEAVGVLKTEPVPAAGDAGAEPAEAEIKPLVAPKPGF